MRSVNYSYTFLNILVYFCLAAVKPDPCQGNPSENGGTFISEGNEFICACTDDYNGELCEHSMCDQSYSYKTLKTSAIIVEPYLYYILITCMYKCSCYNLTHNSDKFKVMSATEDRNVIQPDAELKPLNIDTKAMK